jgi:hypothetical protein
VIHDLEVGKDAAGFPVVSWSEDRNSASPEAMRRARVECRIMKDAVTGVLLFVARGTVRHGAFEEGKPWEHLRGFSNRAADGLYYTKEQLEARQHLGSKSIGGRVALSDGAQVLTAEFVDDTPLHVNCATASPVDIERLHVALTREFVGNQHILVGNLCRDAFQWPVDDDRVMTYDPARKPPVSQTSARVLSETLGWIAALALIGGIAFLLVWWLGPINR